jgi:hypothetical protein
LTQSRQESNTTQSNTTEITVTESKDDIDLHVPYNMAQIIDFAPSPIHGTGVFALVDLEPGTMIIEEDALWAIDRATAFRASFPICTSPNATEMGTSPNATEMRGIMGNAFRRNNPYYPHDEDSPEGIEYKEKIVYLCGGFIRGEVWSRDPAERQKMATERLRQILILNGACEPVGPDQVPVEWVSVFEHSSRINHSCAPNTERATSTDADGKIHVRYRYNYPLPSRLAN